MIVQKCSDFIFLNYFSFETGAANIFSTIYHKCNTYDFPH